MNYMSTYSQIAAEAYYSNVTHSLEDQLRKTEEERDEAIRTVCSLCRQYVKQSCTKCVWKVRK